MFKTIKIINKLSTILIKSFNIKVINKFYKNKRYSIYLVEVSYINKNCIC